MNLTKALYDLLSNDPTLTALLATYNSEPAIFTTDPVPEDAVLPYIVCAGHIADTPNESKTSIGREVLRDIRCYDAKTGSSLLVEQIVERARELVHRQPLTIENYSWILSECTGQVIVDEPDAYGRITTLRVIAEKNEV